MVTVRPSGERAANADPRPGRSHAEPFISGFLQDELLSMPTMGSSGEPSIRSIQIAGTGTVAHTMLQSEAFRRVMEAASVRYTVARPAASVDVLLSDTEWEMALCFSPWKVAMAAQLPELSASAHSIGAVDTVIRRGGHTFGLNSTGWAVRVALDSACSGARPDSVLILGSGASARSVGWAVRRSWGRSVELTFAARNREAAESCAADFAAGVLSLGEIANTGSATPAIVVNATSWGETEESEQLPFGPSLDALFEPWQIFIDLNVRSSALQRAALSAGAAVTSGVAMRLFNNACRAALASRLAGVSNDRHNVRGRG